MTLIRVSSVMPPLGVCSLGYKVKVVDMRTRGRTHKEQMQIRQFFFKNTFQCAFVFSSVLCQKPEKHLGTFLLCPESSSSPNRTLVLPRGEGGEIWALDTDLSL